MNVSRAVKQPDIKARINGVKTKMEKFNFFFGIELGERILKHTDNLLRTLQNEAYSAAEEQIVAELSVRTLQSLNQCVMIIHSIYSGQLFYQNLTVFR